MLKITDFEIKGPGKYVILQKLMGKCDNKTDKAGNAKCTSLYKTRNELTKTVRINFIRTLEINQRIPATRNTLNQEKGSCFFLP